MTYDPRQGASPYLGMDDDFDEDEMFSYNEDEEFDYVALDATRVRLHRGDTRATPADKSRSTDKPLRRSTAADASTSSAGVLRRGKNTNQERPIAGRLRRGFTGDASRADAGRSRSGSASAANGFSGASPSSTVARPGETSARVVPPTVRRPSQAPQRGVAPAPVVAEEPAYTPAIRRPASSAAPRAVPSPQQADPYLGTPVPVVGRAKGFLTSCAALALWILALILRVGGIVLSLMVIFSAVLTDAHRAALVKALNWVANLMPAPILGQFVVETPFGGAFRGDLAIGALLLFVADWLCLKYRASLLERRYGGE